MKRSHPLVEIHFAFWAVMTVPLGFAGIFFLFPGLKLVEGFTLEAVAGLLLLYIIYLTRFKRAAWLSGLFLHAAVLAGAAYYLPRLPLALGLPLVLANLYSLLVLLAFRRLWSRTEATRATEGLAPSQ
jgi:hypothetical protein